MSRPNHYARTSQKVERISGFEEHPPNNSAWMESDKAGESTKKRYTKRTVEIFSSVLHAGSLWQAVVSSPAMNKAFELDELSQASKNYLQALAEAYVKIKGGRQEGRSCL